MKPLNIEKFDFLNMYENQIRGIVKEEYLMIVLRYFFISAYKQMLWVLIRRPGWGVSNEYPQHMFFYGELEKISPNYHQILLLNNSSTNGSNGANFWHMTEVATPFSYDKKIPIGILQPLGFIQVSNYEILKKVDVSISNNYVYNKRQKDCHHISW